MTVIRFSLWVGARAIGWLFVAAVVSLTTAACNASQANTPGRLPQAIQVPNLRLPGGAAGAEWISPAGDSGHLRYSLLSDITPSNVKDLHVVTEFSTGIPNGHEGQPLVVGNVMFVVTPFP